MTWWRDPVGWWCSLGQPLRHLSRGAAVALLLALAAAVVWSSVATADLARADEERVAAKTGERIGDIELYNRIQQRFNEGESYYAAALDEQRQHDYPTTPFVTVRLPTLALVGSITAGRVWQAIALALLIGAVLGWLGALSPLTTSAERIAGALLIFVSAAGLFDARALLFHELIAGMLLTVALGLYRPERWWPSLVFAALALAVRELALPFVLLWGAFALAQRRWKEAAAIAALLVLFAIGMWFHAQGVAAFRLPGDQPSPGWDGFNGPQMALFAMAQLTGLLFLPVWLAAPVALVALVGWIGLGGRLGLFASLYFIGFGVMLSLFARTNNFYWVLLVLPAYAAGLALVPRALADLWHAARAGKTS